MKSQRLNRIEENISDALMETLTAPFDKITDQTTWSLHPSSVSQNHPVDGAFTAYPATPQVKTSRYHRLTESSGCLS